MKLAESSYTVGTPSKFTWLFIGIGSIIAVVLGYFVAGCFGITLIPGTEPGT